MRFGTRSLLLLVSAAFVAGCAGYTTEPLFPAGMRRIAVPIFDNETYFRQIEFDVTRNVCDEIRSRPGVEIVAESDADVVLKGTIRSVSQSILSISDRRKPDEESATTSVSCEIVEARTGRTLKTFSVSERVNFVLATGEGLQTAQREAYYNLARKIVFELESDW
jgi:Lipopolysaccharide-assembly